MLLELQTKFSVLFLFAGTKADSDVTIVDNDSESKGNNDKEWDKDYSSSCEEDSNNKNSGVCATFVINTLTSFMIFTFGCCILLRIYPTGSL
jgi:hypothetical protein